MNVTTQTDPAYAVYDLSLTTVPGGSICSRHETADEAAQAACLLPSMFRRRGRRIVVRLLNYTTYTTAFREEVTEPLAWIEERADRPWVMLAGAIGCGKGSPMSRLVRAVSREAAEQMAASYTGE